MEGVPPGRYPVKDVAQDVFFLVVPGHPVARVHGDPPRDEVQGDLEELVGRQALPANDLYGLGVPSGAALTARRKPAALRTAVKAIKSLRMRPPGVNGRVR